MAVPFSVLLAALLLVLAGFVLLAGVRQYQASGFRFYLVAYAFWGAATVGWGVLLLAGLSQWGTLAFLLGFALERVVEERQKERTRRQYPERWARWQSACRRMSFLDTLLLRYPKV
jgi:hypothetical protein